MIDELFKSSRIKHFMFNREVVEVFDDMINRSVPFYKELQWAISEMALQFISEGDIIYDLGVSTGNTMKILINKAKIKLELVGYDYSAEMIEECEAKLSNERNQHKIILQVKDITNPNLFAHGKPKLVILCLVLQFVNPARRQQIINTIYESLEDGGCLIFVEKNKIQFERSQGIYTEIYECYKQLNGYTSEEINNKRKALENSLIPFTSEENVFLLQSGGFFEVSTFYSFLNFQGFIAIK